MRGESSLGRKVSPCLAALLIFVSPLLAMAEVAADAPEPSDVAAAAPAETPSLPTPDVPSLPADAGRGAPEPPGFSSVNLRVDNNIAGRTRVMDASGNLVAVRATISFMQNGRVVTVARSDESGNFQAAGLRPGVYSVIAMARSAGEGGPAYVSAFSVQVLPFSEQAPDGQLLLDIILMPADDLRQLLGQEESEAPPPPPQPVPYVGGGGGGGGGGLGALLGLAGLAALAAAGQDDGQARPASPFVP